MDSISELPAPPPPPPPAPEVVPVTPDVASVTLDVAPPPPPEAATTADPAVASTVGLVEQPYGCEGDAASLASIDRFAGALLPPSGISWALLHQ